MINWNSIISFIVGLGVAILVEPLRQILFGPRLNLLFTDSEDNITPTPTSCYGECDDRTYVRICAMNKRRAMAKNAKCYLIDVQKKDESGEYVPTIFCDSLQLSWSCTEKEAKFNGIDLPKGVRRYIDLLSAEKEVEHFTLEVNVEPYRYESLFNSTGWFKFTVQIAADGANPSKCDVELYWNGKISDMILR